MHRVIKQESSLSFSDINSGVTAIGVSITVKLAHRGTWFKRKPTFIGKCVWSRT